MSFGIQYNIGPSKAALAKAKALLQDMTPVYRDIGEYLIPVHRKRFAAGVGPDGTAWTPKKQSTLDRYEALGYGKLSRPLIGPSKRLSREIQSVVSRNGVIVGSSLIYARVMQEGAVKGSFGADRHGRPLPWGNIPARTIFGLSLDDQTAIVEIVDEHLGDTLQAG